MCIEKCISICGVSFPKDFRDAIFEKNGSVWVDHETAVIDLPWDAAEFDYFNYLREKCTWDPPFVHQTQDFYEYRLSQFKRYNWKKAQKERLVKIRVKRAKPQAPEPKPVISETVEPVPEVSEKKPIPEASVASTDVGTLKASTRAIEVTECPPQTTSPKKVSNNDKVSVSSPTEKPYPIISQSFLAETSKTVSVSTNAKEAGTKDSGCPPPSQTRVSKAAKQEEKAARRAAKQAEKAKKQAEQQTKKQAEKAAMEAEQAAIEAAREAEQKLAAEAAKQAEQAAKEAEQKQAEQAAKEAEEAAKEKLRLSKSRLPPTPKQFRRRYWNVKQLEVRNHYLPNYSDQFSTMLIQVDDDESDRLEQDDGEDVFEFSVNVEVLEPVRKNPEPKHDVPEPEPVPVPEQPEQPEEKFLVPETEVPEPETMVLELESKVPKPTINSSKPKNTNVYWLGDFPLFMSTLAPKQYVTYLPGDFFKARELFYPKETESFLPGDFAGFKALTKNQSEYFPSDFFSLWNETLPHKTRPVRTSRPVWGYTITNTRRHSYGFELVLPKLMKLMFAPLC
ncbi:uncharacterized protein CXQ87_003483 [Candidozyma duobushaemuli]|uniref:Uncharacterized protein n=2 Tax=Candidozyma TaxID=3303203 RepID=A0ABX8I6C5_9ASCO|nr:uncharacterized protein CXQ87_003483 [[Candida] duobushaemulonis]PVH15637.1 hypothetical protein CXQ87_003483 [[Candida] duobushaemulonis]QWU88834.1 hypothetical protein CA3LBN_003142 [[Candida] haemuloni]